MFLAETNILCLDSSVLSENEMLKVLEFLKYEGSIIANGKIAGWKELVQRRPNTGNTNLTRQLPRRV